MKKIQTFANLSKAEKLIFFKAFFMSAYVRFVTSYLPMRWWYESLLGKQVDLVNHNHTSERGFIHEEKIELIKTRQMVRLACRYAPWEAKCLVESILVKKLFIKNHNLPIYLGLNKIENKYLAHAWVDKESIINNNYEVVSVHV